MEERRYSSSKHKGCLRHKACIHRRNSDQAGYSSVHIQLQGLVSRNRCRYRRHNIHGRIQFGSQRIYRNMEERRYGSSKRQGCLRHKACIHRRNSDQGGYSSVHIHLQGLDSRNRCRYRRHYIHGRVQFGSQRIYRNMEERRHCPPEQQGCLRHKACIHRRNSDKGGYGSVHIHLQRLVSRNRCRNRRHDIHGRVQRNNKHL